MELGGNERTEHNTMMTSSYHEITEGDDEEETGGGGEDWEKGVGGAKRLLNKARNWVGDLSLDGVVSQQGTQLTFVKGDISKQIQISSPTGEDYGENEEEFRPSSPSDLNLIVNEIELEAKKLASSVDTLTENLTGILHSLSSMTVDCVFAGSDGVTQLCDTADASIKVMYQVMAKSEELNKAVQPIYQVHQQIKDTKKLLDKVESEMN